MRYSGGEETREGSRAPDNNRIVWENRGGRMAQKWSATRPMPEEQTEKEKQSGPKQTVSGKEKKKGFKPLIRVLRPGAAKPQCRQNGTKKERDCFSAKIWNRAPGGKKVLRWGQLQKKRRRDRDSTGSELLKSQTRTEVKKEKGGKRLE